MLFVCSVDEMNIDHDCHVFVFRCVFVTVCKLYPLLQVFREESWKHQLKEQQRRDKIKSSEMKEKSYRQYFHYHHSCVAKKKNPPDIWGKTASNISIHDSLSKTILALVVIMNMCAGEIFLPHLGHGWRS